MSTSTGWCRWRWRWTKAPPRWLRRPPCRRPRRRPASRGRRSAGRRGSGGARRRRGGRSPPTWTCRTSRTSPGSTLLMPPAAAGFPSGLACRLPDSSSCSLQLLHEAELYYLRKSGSMWAMMSGPGRGARFLYTRSSFLPWCETSLAWSVCLDNSLLLTCETDAGGGGGPRKGYRSGWPMLSHEFQFHILLVLGQMDAHAKPE